MTRGRSDAGADMAVDAEVISIRDPGTPHAGMDPEMTSLLNEQILSNEPLLEKIRRVAQQAEDLTNDALAGMTPEQFSGHVMSGSGLLEEKLALAEMQSGLAKHGLTPLNTVEGLIKLREALVRAYVDNTLVPVETSLKAAQVAGSLAVLKAKQEFVVAAEASRARTDSLKAELELFVAEQRVSVDKTISEMAERLRLADSTVEIAGQSKSVDIRAKYQDDEKENERLRKALAVKRERFSIIRRQVIRPVVRVAIAVLVPLILVSNLIADAPSRHNTFLFGTVNRAWDAIYMPVRDGVMRTVHHFDGPATTKPTPAPPKAHAVVVRHHHRKHHRSN